MRGGGDSNPFPIGTFRACARTGEWASDKTLHEIHGFDYFGPHSQADFVQLIHGTQMDFYNNFWDSVGAKANYRRLDQIIRPNDNTARWILSFGNMILDPIGDPVEFAGSVIDITSNIRLAQAQQHIHIREMSSAHNQAPGSVLYYDL